MMPWIKLTQGYATLVDDEDYEMLSRVNWFANVGLQVRAVRMVNRQMIYMHRQITGAEVGQEVDHIDRNPLNNTRRNLRIVTHEENMQNTLRSLNKKGYCWNARARLYSVYLDRPGKSRKYLGYAKTEEEAIARLTEARDANSQQ